MIKTISRAITISLYKYTSPRNDIMTANQLVMMFGNESTKDDLMGSVPAMGERIAPGQ
jgi:hypothetical protein